jgi:hypothetical protein
MQQTSRLGTLSSRYGGFFAVENGPGELRFQVTFRQKLCRFSIDLSVSDAHMIDRFDLGIRTESKSTAFVQKKSAGC